MAACPMKAFEQAGSSCSGMLVPVSHIQFSGTCGVAQLDNDSFLEGELESIGYKVEDNLFHVRCGSPRLWCNSRTHPRIECG
jgi:hypothetical protein